MKINTKTKGNPTKEADDLKATVEPNALSGDEQEALDQCEMSIGIGPKKTPTNNQPRKPMTTPDIAKDENSHAGPVAPLYTLHIPAEVNKDDIFQIAPNADEEEVQRQELTPAETTELKKHEAVIDQHQERFIDVCVALYEILNQRLFKATHSKFEDYCKERFGFSRAHAYRHAQVGKEVVNGGKSPDGDNPLPKNEHQARKNRKMKKDAATNEAVAGEGQPKTTASDGVVEPVNKIPSKATKTVNGQEKPVQSDVEESAPAHNILPFENGGDLHDEEDEISVGQLQAMLENLKDDASSQDLPEDFIDALDEFAFAFDSFVDRLKAKSRVRAA